MRKKVFIYVGHSNWGKSMALKVLTYGDSRKKTTSISGQIFRVRKMSNDDNGIGLLEWVKIIHRINFQFFIIALCPKIPPADKAPTEEQLVCEEILNELLVKHDLFFFIQKEKFNNPLQQITQEEINFLDVFGTVHTLFGQNPFSVRAEEFKEFIKANI